MRFSTLSLLATVASAAFSFAAPVTPATNALQARHCACEDIHGIITDVTYTLTPLVAQLTYVTSENCTAEILTPIIGEIKSVLTIAITDVKSLTGKTTTTLLTTVEGVVLTVSDVAQLVCGLLVLVFTALGAVLKVVATADVTVIKPLLVEVAVLVATLLQLILNLVGGLLAILFPLLGGILAPVLSIILNLGVTDCFSFLNVTWSSVSSSVVASATTVVSTSLATAATTVVSSSVATLTAA